jgi:hypothetical protein
LEKHGWLKRWIDIGLEWASEYYKCMDRTNAYIVAMGKPSISLMDRIFTCLCFVVINPSLRMSWIKKHWDTSYIDNAEKVIKDMVRICPDCFSIFSTLYRCTAIVKEQPLKPLDPVRSIPHVL